MYLLDTDVVSELRKIRGGKADPNVVAWAGSVDASQLFVSAISILELQLSVLSIERMDPRQGELLRSWLEQRVLPEFAGRTLAVDTDVTLRCASLHIPSRRSEADALIATTALVHSMTVVTRNVADFVSTGVSIINPWNASPVSARRR